MIRRLRLKFIAVTMGALVLVFAVLFVILNGFMQNASTRQTDMLLEMVAERDGFQFPPSGTNMPPEGGRKGYPYAPNNEVMRAGRFFYLKADSSGEYFEINFEMMFGFTEEEAVDYADSVIAKNRERGTVGILQYLIAGKEYGKIIVFAERSIETQLLSRLSVISAWVAGGTCLVLLAFTFFLSKWAVSPVKTAFDKQRQFIADASHELKTPLTIISTNVDVLENEIGGSTRLDHIRAQAARMSALINDLLSLARTDEGGTQTVMAEFDMKKAVLSTTLEFESRAFEEGKELKFRLDEDIRYTGDEKQIRQLAAILIDNAVRYSNPGGEISVTLRCEGGGPVLSVYNTGDGVPSSERERIFDRFYRSDASRARETGGYGLGLAIANAIVTAHKGRIAVTGRVGEWVCFSVYL